MEQISRPFLARAGVQAGLSAQAMDAALDLAGLRPNAAEWRDFGVRAMRFAGVLSLAAGAVFLVAFNWQNLGLFARFAMVEAALLASIVTAWTKGLDHLSGKLALMLGVLLTGAFLALFGQSYQTGADVYELFLGWAALTLPWVIACRYAPCWALWLVLINAAMMLYVAAEARGWMMSLFRDRWQWAPFSLPFLLNLLIYVTLIMLSRWKELGLDESWLRRGVMAVAMTFGTFSMVYRVASHHSEGGAAIGLEILLFLIASAGFAVHAYAQKQDLFNFAVLALSWIVVSTTLIGNAMLEDHAGVGTLFVIAIYVIATSTGAVKGISHLSQQWRAQQWKAGEPAQ